MKEESKIKDIEFVVSEIYEIKYNGKEIDTNFVIDALETITNELLYLKIKGGE